MDLTYVTLWHRLARARNVLIVLQEHPDGDNLGSCTALFFALRNAGVHVALAYLRPLSPQWSFLPDIPHAITPLAALMHVPWEYCIFTDTSDRNFGGVGQALAALTMPPIVVNIDHHMTNDRFGDINIVDTHAAAAAAVVTEMLRAAHVPFTADIATCLLTGLMTDTGFFSNPATDDRALAIGAFLLEQGAHAPRIARALLRNKSTKALRFWGSVFETVTVHPRYGIAVVVIDRDALAQAGLTDEDVDGMTNFLNLLGEARVVCVVRRGDTGVKVSLRTTRPHINLARLAIFFGGGGHQKAAGFRYAGRLEKTAMGWKVL